MIRLRSLGALDLCRDDGSELRPVLRQPKRLALLTYLAVAPPRGFQRRDTLVALFWPELDSEHARGALRQAVRFLRRQLGEDALVSRGDEELALGAGVWCDAAAFEEAASQHQPEEALELYRGDFLAGFFVSEAAPELDQWIETQRVRLRALAARTAWLLAAKEELEGSPRGATHWARRALALSAHDEAALRQLVSLLDRLGDRAGAIQAYEDFAQGLAKEYDAEPSAETRALVAAVRARVNAPSAAAVTAGETPRSRLAPAGASSPRRRPVRIGAVLLAGVVVIGGAIAALTRVRADEPIVLAVGAIHDHTGSDSARRAGALADLLATNLARVPGVQVVSTARLYELLGQLGRFTDSSAAIARAARQAGATELVEGALYRAPDGTLRLDLRRVDLEGGTVHGAYSARGAHLFALVDSATGELARALDARTPALRVADVTTSSLVAQRFYEEGLRVYFQGDARSAQRLFAAALADDSAFAMAAYFVAMCSLAMGDEHAARAPLIRAARLAERATERERLLIRTTLAFEAHEPEGLAIAETLAARYPTEPDGHLLVGRGRSGGGDLLGALPHLRRVVEMDSLSFRGGAVRCRACEAFGLIAGNYWAADSFAAAERTAREALRRTRGAPAWLYELAWIFERQGRRDEALATFQRVPPQTYADEGLTFRASLAIRTGDFAEADRMLNEILRVGAADLQGGALWFLSISLRYQGRVSEALAVARRLRRLWENLRGEPSLIEAQALFEMGRPRAAAALFDSLGRLAPDPDFPARTARQRTWMFTHLATSLAAAGDTVALAGLADSLEVYGRRSAYGRDRRLHHHARGLLWRARGQPAEAEAAFRRAIYAATAGYTRTHLELGRTLLELNRPHEAIGVVAPALRGPLDASNLYVTHTELHELLARAYDTAGQRDSAATHYRWVVNAWRNADPLFRSRTEQAQRWLAARAARP